MKDEESVELLRIKNDPKKKKIALSGLPVLLSIKSLQEAKKEPTTGNITLEHYKEETGQLSKKDKTHFVNKRRSMISRRLSNLQEIGLIRTLEGTNSKDGRAKPYFLTPSGHELVNDENKVLSLMEHGSDSREGSSNEIESSDLEYRRKFHSNRIRVLLKKIKEELSGIFDKKFIPETYNSINLKIQVNNPSFKKDPLYEDLENHIKTFTTFVGFSDKLDDFTSHVNKYLELEDLIHQVVQNELSLRLGLEYSEQLDKTNSFGSNLVDWVVKRLHYLNAKEMKIYNRYSMEFNSEKEKIRIGIEKYKQIRIDGETVMKLSLTKKESYFLDKVKEMMTDMDNVPIMEHYSSMVLEKEESHNILHELLQDLDREIEIPIYPGICKYLSPSAK